MYVRPPPQQVTRLPMRRAGRLRQGQPPQGLEKTAMSDQRKDGRKDGQQRPPLTTNDAGIPVGSDEYALTVGANGPVLLQDAYLLEKLGHFVRERVPNRVYHVKGYGAFGYFEVTADVTQWTKAAFLNKVGKRTPMFVRFSIVAGEEGYPDTDRDVRGFAMKFYTEEGNYDLVGNNTPVFFVRDPMKFPDFIHSQERQPDTGLALLRVDEVRELHGVTHEEDRRVVADEVVVAFFGVELHGEAAHVAVRVRVALFAGHDREAHEHRRALANFVEEGSLGPLGDVGGHLEVAKRTIALDVVHAIGDALADEVAQLLDQVGILQEDGAVGADRERVLVALHGAAGIGCCERSLLFALVTHMFLQS